MKRFALFTLILLFGPSVNAAEIFLFQGFDSPDRYQKLPIKSDRPVLMVYVPRACPRCWNEWRTFYSAFARWEKTHDVWFIGDFPLWSEGRDLFRQRSFPAKVSNQAYYDPGRRFGKSVQAGDKRPSLIVGDGGGKFTVREVAREKDWAPQLNALLGVRR